MVGGTVALAGVIGDDNLLRKILLRLGFPAFLVHAALVSKRWLGLAADPAFLRRFRDRHPPQLIGFYIHEPLSPRPQFVPVSEAPELQAAVSRAGFDHGDLSEGPFCCRNGRILLKPAEFTYGQYILRSPLCPTRGVIPVSPPPPGVPGYQRGLVRRACFLSRDSSDSIVYVYLLRSGRKLLVQVYVLQSGAWGEGIVVEKQPMAVTELDFWMVMAAHGKLYILTDTDCILRLDYAAPRPQFFTIELPNGVVGNYKLSSADDTGLFLIHGKGSQLSVWHHEMDGNSEDNWELVESFCVRTADDRSEGIHVLGVADNAEFVFLGLQASRAIVCVNLRSRKETLYEVTVGLFCHVRVFPFMTVWPPIFPALTEEDNHGE